MHIEMGKFYHARENKPFHHSTLKINGFNIIIASIKYLNQSHLISMKVQ